MRKAKSTISRLLTVALVLVMVLSMSVTAFAAGMDKNEDGYNYTIKINPNENTTKGGTGKDDVNTRYHAYPIFEGAVDDDGYDKGSTDRGNGGIKDPNKNTLADITWGEGIKPTEFVQGLLNDTTTTGEQKNESALSTSLQAALTTAGYTATAGDGEVGSKTWTLPDGKNWNDPKLAQAVAQWLSDNPEYVKDFSDIAGKNLNEDKYYESEWKPAGESDGTKDHWEIGKVPGGYYLITDNYTEDKPVGENGGANSEFMLFVAGNAEVDVKSDAPTNKKEIVPPSNNANGAAGSGNANGDVLGVGDDVTFLLTGTLPENYSEYDSYKYIFHDKMSDGLTPKGVKQVYVKVYKTDGTFGPDEGENASKGQYDVYVIEPNATDGHTNGYTYTAPANHGASEDTFDVDFGDLKQLKGKKATSKDANGNYVITDVVEGSVPLGYGVDICIEYTATLNSNAVHKEDNKSHLEYSNNPEDNEETGKTPDDEVYVYTFGLDNTKVGVGEDLNGLGGAGFAVSKKVTEPNPAHTQPDDGQPATVEVTYYAVFTKKSVTNPDGAEPENVDAFVVSGWITENQLLAAVNAVRDTQSKDHANTVADITEDEWIAAYQTLTGVNGLQGTAPYYLTAKSADTTGKFYIWGLDEGIYTLSEKVTPPGYNTMDDFDITIKADVEADGQIGNNADKKSSATDNSDAVDTTDTDMETDGWIDLKLKNTKTTLPGTGGIGTTIFQVSGIVLLVGAAIYLFVSSSKKREAR